MFGRAGPAGRHVRSIDLMGGFSPQQSRPWARAGAAVIAEAHAPDAADVLDLIEQGMLTRGDKNNRVYVGDTVRFESAVSKEMQSALFDPQTAGGLLISLPEGKVADLLAKIPDASVIGRVSGSGEPGIVVE